MKKFYLLLISVLAFPLSMYAQEQDTLRNTENVIPVVPAKVENTDSLLNEIKELQAQIEQYKATSTELKGKIYDCEQEITAKNAKIEMLNNHLIFADSIIARLSNDCLRKKYDKVRVDQAISNFEQMYSSELKSKFGRLKFLLSEYGNYTQDFVALFTAAQNDKALSNPFTGQKQALTYIDKIKETRYYKEVYNDNWTIPYLNNLIDKSFETIKSFNPKENKEIHLLELMN